MQTMNDQELIKWLDSAEWDDGAGRPAKGTVRQAGGITGKDNLARVPAAIHGICFAPHPFFERAMILFGEWELLADNQAVAQKRVVA